MAHLAEDDVGAAVEQIAEEHRSLVSRKANGLAEPVTNDAADKKSDTSHAPELSEALRAALENDFAEQA